MMKDTDFDLLCAGATPDEARRLRKILSEWVRGDEDAFPVQLALLTKSQWRTAAMIPKLLEAERQALAEVLAQAKKDARSAAESVRDGLRLYLAAFKEELTRQTTVIKDATRSLQVKMSEGETLAKEIRRTLAAGEKEWEEARTSFVNERQALTHAVHEAQVQLDAGRSWTTLLGLGLALLVGSALGAWVTYEIVVR